MDVNAIARLSTVLSETRQGQEIGTTVLKKTLDIAASNAAALIASVPAPASSSLPAHLGNNINTTA
ncbi:MAG: putative motility protein [Oxalobacteraceae bacterium]|nr:MAG: putative motility protein [Oxalobacteraceae bacterium]